MRLVALLAALLAVPLAGCAHARLDDPPLAMELSATGLKEDERALLKDQLCAMQGVSGCELEHKKGTTTVKFSYRGSLGELRARIAELPHPGLTPKAAAARLEYDGFDNLPPTITPLEPKAGVVLNYKRVLFRVAVPDKDTASVTVGGQAASRSDDAWQATLELGEGSNSVAVVAKDEVGNEREASMSVAIDTTPPQLEVTLTAQPGDVILLEGKVLEGGAVVEVDGKPVALDLFNGFSAEVRRDPDKQSVVIVARDEHGNELRQRRSLKDGRVLQ